MAGKQIHLDGQTLHGKDRFGWWQVSEILGWFESPPPKSDEIERPTAHGNFMAPVKYGQRIVSLKGRLIAGSHELALDARDALSSLVFQPATFSVCADNSLVTHGTAVRGRITPKSIIGRWLTFEAELKFPDPFRYGEYKKFEVTPGEAEMVSQWGTVEAWPVVVVTGSMSGYRLRFRGVDVHVNTSVSAGQTHRVEYKSRRLYINGQFMMGFFGDTNFQPCEPGVRHGFELIPDSGTGKAVMTIVDTYI